MNMNPSMCGQNSIFVPTADPCTNCCGGGGLSTASVEFICSSGSYIVTVASTYDDFIVVAPMFILSAMSRTVDIPLGDDGAILAYDCFVGLGETPIVVTGDIVADDDNGGFIITGDGTITAEGRNILPPTPTPDS